MIDKYEFMVYFIVETGNDFNRAILSGDRSINQLLKLFLNKPFSIEPINQVTKYYKLKYAPCYSNVYTM
jgi:hypothetical protein